jgi:hypothetical protein
MEKLFLNSRGQIWKVSDTPSFADWTPAAGAQAAAR